MRRVALLTLAALVSAQVRESTGGRREGEREPPPFTCPHLPLPSLQAVAASDVPTPAKLAVEEVSKGEGEGLRRTAG